MCPDQLPEPSRSLDEARLRAVARALAALRRGEPVLVGGADGNGTLVLAAALAEGEALARFERLVGGAEPVPAALDLTVLARLPPAALTVPVRHPRGGLRRWAARHDVLFVRARDVAGYRIHAERRLRKVADARVPLAGAEDTRIVAFRPADGGPEHLAIVIGAPNPDAPVLVRLHAEGFTADLLGSLRGEPLRGAIAEVARHGGGVLLYMAQEGRGTGLTGAPRAGRTDETVYPPAAEMLRQLGVRAVRLLTDDPGDLRRLTRQGIAVAGCVPRTAVMERPPAAPVAVDE